MSIRLFFAEEPEFTTAQAIIDARKNASMTQNELAERENHAEFP